MKSLTLQQKSKIRKKIFLFFEMCAGFIIGGIVFLLGIVCILWIGKTFWS